MSIRVSTWIRIDWLTQLVNNHNNANPGVKVSLTPDLDSQAGTISLGDIFTRGDESAVAGLDFSDVNSNILYIGASLAVRGYDNIPDQWQPP